MESPDFMGPVNIGSEEMVTINELVDTVALKYQVRELSRGTLMDLLEFVVETPTTISSERNFIGTTHRV